MVDTLPAAVLLSVPISHPQRQKDDIQGTLYAIHFGHAAVVWGLLLVVISIKNSLSV